MPSRRLKIREIMLLSAPCVLIPGAGAWLAQRQQAARAEHTSALRTVITQIETLPVTPLESWQGFDWKVVIHAKVAEDADLLRSLTPYANQWFEGQPKLVWRKGKVEREFRSLDETYASSQAFWRSEKPMRHLTDDSVPIRPLEETYILLCSDQMLPRGGEIYLRGEGIITTPVKTATPLATIPPELKSTLDGRRRGMYFLNPRPAKYNIPLRLYGPENPLPPVDRKAPKTGPLLEHRRLPPMAGYGRPQPDTLVRFELSPPDGEPENSSPRWQFGQCQLIDEQGRVLPGFDKLRSQRPDITVYKSLKTKRWTGELKFNRREWRVKPGTVRFSTFVSYENSWPTRLILPLQSAGDWQDQTCRDLKFLNATQWRNTVTVQLQHNGKQPLAVQRMGIWFDAEEEPFRNFLSSSPPNPNEDDLITSWSQHIDSEDRLLDWLEVRVLSAISVNHVVTVEYQWAWPPTLKKPVDAVFSADSGIRGQGFVKTSTPVVITTEAMWNTRQQTKTP